MTTATITETIELPAAAKPKQVKVRLRLIATEDGSDAAGYATAADATVMGEWSTSPNGQGVYSFAGVRPNSGSSADVIDSPTGTTYQLIVSYPDGRSVTRYLSVPDSAGPHQVHDLVTDAPASITPTPLARHIANTATAHPTLAQDQHVESLRSWNVALENLSAGPARVVLITDSMGVLSNGFDDVWSVIHKRRTADDLGFWWPPAMGGGTTFFNWNTMEGTWVEQGLDGYAAEFAAGEAGAVTTARPARYLDMYYTAQADGGDVEVTVNGSVVGTIDTSLDQDGAAVASDTPHQRWRYDLGSITGATFSVAVSGGSVILEAAHWNTDSGVVRYGGGHSGWSVADWTSNGAHLTWLQQMVDNGETPDLVVLAADTGDTSSPDPATRVAQVTAQVAAVRAIVGAGVSIAHWIPPAHAGLNSSWSSFVSQFREMADDLGVRCIDSSDAMGDVSNSSDPFGLSSDGTHFSTLGVAVNSLVWIEALDGGNHQLPPLASLDGVDLDLGTVDDGTLPALVSGDLTVEDTLLRVLTYSGTTAHLRLRDGPTSTALGQDFEVVLVHNALYGVQLRTFLDGVDQGLKPFAVADAVQDYEAATWKQVSAPATVAVAASRALASTDRGKTLLVSAAATVTLANLSTATWPVGGWCRIVQTGTGAATISAGGGQTLHAPSGGASTDQGQEGVLRRVAASTWIIDWGTTKTYVDGQGFVVGDGVTNVVALTQAEYDALGTPDASTLYVVTD